MSNRKLLLAHIRNGNYAHAGEEEAIELVLSLMTKNPNQTLLDIGCGLGGTADYIEKQGFGKVIGIDVDPSVLKNANKLYPHIQFHLCDANTIDAFFKDQKFDVLYSFNAFFCFKTQENCLKAFSKIAQDNAALLIFDYSSERNLSKTSPFYDQTQSSTAATSFYPINLDAIEKQLFRSNWKLNKIVNLDEQYQLWYQSLISKMENNKEDLIFCFGEITFNDLYAGYIQLLKLIEQKEIGGTIIHASLHN